MTIISDSLIPVSQGIHPFLIDNNGRFIFEIRQSTINICLHDGGSVIVWDIIDVDKLVISVVLSCEWIKKSDEFVILCKVSAWWNYANG